MPTAERSGERIHVETTWSEKEQIKAISGSRWEPASKKWSLPLSWAACLQLRGVFGSTLEVGPELTAWSWREFELRVRPATELRSAIDRAPGNWDVRLYDFQTSGAAFLRVSTTHQENDHTGGALLGDDLGLGKTAQVLATLDALLEEIDVDPSSTLPAVVFSPNSVKTAWEVQVEKWNAPVTPYVVTGGAAARRKIIETARSDPSALVIINIESARLFSRLAPYGSVRLARCIKCDKKTGNPDLTPA